MMNARLLLIAAVLAPLTGCEWIKRIGPNDDKPKPGTGPLPAVQPEQLVGFINERSARLQSLNFGDVRLVASDHGIPLPALRGSLAASQPRNFRMTGSGGAMGAKVDLGSNTEQFWVYFAAPTIDPKFVYASHTDFEGGRARIPGGIPFEPDWVMQALGMTSLPPGNQYTVRPDEKTRTYILSWPATTPSGLAVVKEVVFEGDAATGTRAQVKRHVIRDQKGKVICAAETRQAKTVTLPTTDPRTNLPQTVQYPTLIVLRWEEQKFEMELELKTGRVNEPIDAEQAARLFKRPTVPGTPAVDLAGGTFPVR